MRAASLSLPSSSHVQLCNRSAKPSAAWVSSWYVGCWTSVSRKSVRPIFEQLNGLLFYPVQYEGEESSRNIFYTGAAPNQQAIAAVRYLSSNEGGKVRRGVLLGTDYVYPRTINRILGAYLAADGVSPDDVMTIYTPFGHYEWREIVGRIKAFGSE